MIQNQCETGFPKLVSTGTGVNWIFWRQDEPKLGMNKNWHQQQRIRKGPVIEHRKVLEEMKNDSVKTYEEE